MNNLFKTLSLVALIFALVPSAALAEGSGIFKISYYDTDEDGNLSVNRETYNQYDQSVLLSLENFNYLMSDDVRLTANLKNISANNRDLSARLYKRGLFSISATNKQYRRIYDFDGNFFTRRRASTFNAEVTPVKRLKLFGGASVNDRAGNSMLTFSPVQDTIFSRTDYRYANYHGGFQAFCPFGSVRAVYRRGEFMNDVDYSLDRKSETVDISVFSRIPNYRQVMVSGGYITRYDEVYDSELRIDRDQFWGALRWNLKQAATVEYKLLSASVEDGATDMTTDHVVHKFSAGKQFAGYGGLRAGYQMSNSKDDVDELESNGFMASGWFDYVENLLVKARIFVNNKEVTKGATLIGDEDFTRSSVSARYRLNDMATVSGKYEGKVRKYDDLDSRVDYTIMTTSADLSFENLTDLSVSYSYYLGEFENMSDSVNYEFADNILRGELRPRMIDMFEFIAGVTYLRGHRDHDVDKVNADFTGKYAFGKGHYLQLRYNLVTYDDYMRSQNYYTANIIEVSFIKDLHW